MNTQVVQLDLNGNEISSNEVLKSLSTQILDNPVIEYVGLCQNDDIDEELLAAIKENIENAYQDKYNKKVEIKIEQEDEDD